jgi:hypothetical protein
VQHWEYYFVIREGTKFLLNGIDSPPAETWWNYDPKVSPIAQIAKGLGQDGWEMISFQYHSETHFSMAFKRPTMVI